MSGLSRETIAEMLANLKKDLAGKDLKIEELRREFEEKSKVINQEKIVIQATIDLYESKLDKSTSSTEIQSVQRVRASKVNGTMLAYLIGRLGGAPKKGERGHRNWVLATALEDGEKDTSNIIMLGENHRLKASDMRNVLSKDYQRGRYGRRPANGKGFRYANISWYDSRNIGYTKIYKGEVQTVEFDENGNKFVSSAPTQ